jgi:hypothetical protein
MNETLIREFQELEDNFNTILALNNIEQISPYLSGDWVLLQPEFGIISKERFLHVIQSGDLLHISMKKEVLRVSIQNDIAIVTSRGMNIGTYKETTFDTEHWVTNIYKNENSNWICIMTQEAAVICKPS